MFRVEDLRKVPYFESRANQFVSKVERLAGIYPNVYALAQNKTLKELETGPTYIDFIRREYPEFLKAEWTRDHEKEIESSYMNIAGVTMGSEYRKELAEFIRTVDDLAKELGARKDQTKRVTDNGPNSKHTHRYEGELWYIFD